MLLASAAAHEQRRATSDSAQRHWPDHAIVQGVADDDRAVIERLAALEAEVKADADAQRARKEAALAKVREQRAAQQAERDELRKRQAALVTQEEAARRSGEAESRVDDLGGALELAGKANRSRQELDAQAGQGREVVDQVAASPRSRSGRSAGSTRARCARRCPRRPRGSRSARSRARSCRLFLLMPVLHGRVAAVGHRRRRLRAAVQPHGSRQRLFGDRRRSSSSRVTVGQPHTGEGSRKARRCNLLVDYRRYRS